MKLLLENFKKNMKEFKGPTADPEYSDPGYDDPQNYDHYSDLADEILSKAEDQPKRLQNVSNNMHVAYDGIQYFTYSSEAPASLDDYDEMYPAENREQLIDDIIETLINDSKEQDALDATTHDLKEIEMNTNTILENEIKTLVKNKIEEKLGQQAANLAKKMKVGAVSRVMDLITKRVAKLPVQQKIEFAIEILGKIGIQPTEMEQLMMRFKSTISKAAKGGGGKFAGSQYQGAGGGTGGAPDPAAAAVSQELQK